MAYNKKELEKWREIAEPYNCPTCPYCNGQRDPTIKHKDKLKGFDFYKSMGDPKLVVAPMVDQSELPFRMMCRKYGADLAYTPMFHARLFAEDPNYRERQFTTVPEDRPLLVQFCANDGDMLLEAAKHVVGRCDGVDINFGCPQGIARRGHYGSYLMEDWATVHTLIHTLSVELPIPVTAKIRRFDELDLTLKYARMVRDAGAQVLAVHGRTREMKGQQSGMADWGVIRAVKEHITEIPVLANGNILTSDDIKPCFEQTKVNGLLSAEALLWDPKLFSFPVVPVRSGRMFKETRPVRMQGIHTALEYLEFCAQYPVELGWTKAHLFKILYHSLDKHTQFRAELGEIPCGVKATTKAEDFAQLVLKLKEAEEALPDDAPAVPVERSSKKAARGEREGNDSEKAAVVACSEQGGATTVPPVCATECESATPSSPKAKKRVAA